MDEPPLTARDKVTKWFVSPLIEMKRQGHGELGFIALMVAIALAERIIASKKKYDKTLGIKWKSFEICGADFLGISEPDFNSFWSVYRNGLMHHAQPFSGIVLRPEPRKKKKRKSDANPDEGVFWDWDISDAEGYEALPKITETEPGKKLITINPWEWLNHVAAKYDEYPHLIDLPDARQLGFVRRELQTSQTSTLQFLDTHPGPPKYDLKSGSFHG